MTVGEIIAIVLTALTGITLIASLIIFACFVIKNAKEKPAEKLLGGFAITFLLSVVLLVITAILVVLFK